MPERTLKRIVDELRESLDRSGDLDEESRAALRDAAREIDDALEGEGVAGLAASLRERIAQSIERFEGEHPRLTETVRRLVDQLSEMGI